MSRPILGDDVAIDVDRLLVSRLLVQANSGGGKSRALRRLLEQTFGRCQQIVLDWEGEFATLREKFDYVLIGKGGEAAARVDTAALVAIRLLELGNSAVIDLSELGSERHAYVAAFLDSMINAPRDLWHAVMVVVDEAHRLCPEKGKARKKEERKSTEDSRAAVIALMDLGRKRGYCGVLATQRIAKLDKDAAYECTNKLIGRSISADAKRAGEEIDLAPREAIQKLSTLRPGEFYAFGPAFGDEIRLVRTGPVQTTHPEPGQAAPPPPPPSAKVREVLSKLKDLPADAVEEARTVGQLRARVRELESQLAGNLPVEALRIKTVEVPVIDADGLANLLKGVELLDKHTAELDRVRDRMAQAQQCVVSEADSLRRFADKLAIESQTAGARPASIATTSPQTGRSERSRGAKARTGELAGSERRVSDVTAGETAPIETARAQVDTSSIVNGLAAIEAFGLPRTIAALAAWMNVHPRSSSFLRALGVARLDELVAGLELTAGGRKSVDVEVSDPRTAVDTLRRPLSESQLRIVDTIASFPDRKVTIPVLAAWVGVHPRSSSFLKDLGKLRERSYVDGTELTAIGTYAAESRKLDDLEVIEQLEDMQRRIVESTGARGEFKTIAELASSLGVHPRSSTFLGDIGKLRERGLVSKGWPLKLTDVFQGVAS